MSSDRLIRPRSLFPSLRWMGAGLLFYALVSVLGAIVTALIFAAVYVPSDLALATVMLVVGWAAPKTFIWTKHRLGSFAFLDLSHHRNG